MRVMKLIDEQWYAAVIELLEGIVVMLTNLTVNVQGGVHVQVHVDVKVDES